MKKKIALNNIKVSSFVTELGAKDKKQLKGGAELPETLFSCLDYISCNPVDCLDIS